MDYSAGCFGGVISRMGYCFAEDDSVVADDHNRGRLFYLLACLEETWQLRFGQGVLRQTFYGVIGLMEQAKGRKIQAAENE